MLPVPADVLERFRILEQLLDKLASLELGPSLAGVPVRWIERAPYRFRCGRGHVTPSEDPCRIVVASCPVCAEPVAVTSPEDS
jgi:hypothetical protein